MAASCFIAWNANTSALTGPPTAVATAATSGTVRTMLQIVPTSTAKIRVIEWGYTFDGIPANTVRMELVETGTVAATVSAHVSGSIHPYNDQGATSTDITLGTTATGYSATLSTGEGTVTATRLLDYHYESGLYLSRMWPLGREVEVGPSKVLRIRATPTSAAAVNISCYIVWEE